MVQVFFLPKNIFLAIELKTGKLKKKNRNLCFTRRTTEAWSIFAHRVLLTKLCLWLRSWFSELSYSFMGTYQTFGRTSCLHLQGINQDWGRRFLWNFGYLSTKSLSATSHHTVILVHLQCRMVQLKTELGSSWTKQSNEADRYTTQTRQKRPARNKGRQYCLSCVKNLNVCATPTPRPFALSQGSYSRDLDKWVWNFERWTQPKRVYICSTHPPVVTLHSKSTTFAIPWSFW